MVSFDAFRHDYIDRYQPEAFLEVAARGVRADALIPAFPSKTFPNHYSIATGLYPGNHGIVGNTFYDPERSAWYKISDTLAIRDEQWYRGEPIWVTAERNGVKSAVYYWTGSEAAVGGIRPTYWKPYDAKVPNAARVNGVVKWLRLPGTERPHLVLLYFSEVDDSTHKHGPDSASTSVAVRDVNSALRQLLDSVRQLPQRDSVNVVLVSDHGMTLTSTSQLIPLGDILVRGGVDTSGVRLSDNGPEMSLWFGGPTDRARRARDLLNAATTHARAYLRGETPERWHARANDRFGDVIVVADEGYIIERSASDKAPTSGAHGYDPAVPNMQAIFLAAGPNVRPLGILPPFENVNIYPFVAALLRLRSVPLVDGTLAPLGAALR